MRYLYHLPLSPFSRKVRLVLAEKRLPFELRLEKVWERRPEYLELNPAGTVPTLVESNGLTIPDSGVICEYLEEAYPDIPLLGRTPAERIEVRRLVAWFDGKFATEVTRNLLGEKFMKRLAGRGNPDATALRLGYAAVRHHLEYVGWLSETRKWLAGSAMSLADFAAAAHLSALDYIGDIDWAISQPAKEWYARMKSRPSFRGILSDRSPASPHRSITRTWISSPPLSSQFARSKRRLSDGSAQRRRPGFGRHEDRKRPLGCPAGARYALPECRRIFAACRKQRARTGNGSTCEQPRQVGRNPLLGRGLLQQLGEQEDISGTAARNSGYGIEKRFVLNPRYLANCLQKLVAEAALGRPDPQPRCRDCNARTYGRRRIRHGSYNTRLIP